MLNQVTIVGRLVEKPTLIDLKLNQKKVCNITLAVPRNFKNEIGEYKTDFIPCVLWENIAENVVEYCEKGDLVGIHGRVQNEFNSIKIHAEKVTFLSTKKKDDENE